MKIINFRVTNEDIENYANLSGDYNPIHLNREYARQHGFANKMAHGMLTMAKVWSVTSNELQIYQLPVQFDLSFLSPVYAGDQITLSILKKENKIDIKGTCQDKTVVKGMVLLPYEE